MSPVVEPADRVWVIIVNFNAGALLPRCLDALATQTLVPDQVLVVDNGSSDGSADGLEHRFPRLQVLRTGTNLGFAAANNLAVHHAVTADWVALLNPDAFPDPPWLERMMEAAARAPRAQFLGCRLIDDRQPDRLDGDGDVYHVSGAAWRRLHHVPIDLAEMGGAPVFSPCAAAALYEREAFLAVGGFDERLFCYLEDVDLGFRLRLAGYQGMHVKEGLVRHLGSAITGTLSDFSLYHIQRNLVWVFFKNMPFPLLLRYLPQHLLLNLMGVFALARRGKGRVAVRAKLAALRGLPAVWRERRRVQRRRRLDAATLDRAFIHGWLAPYRRDKDRAHD